jgi:chemotaxis protein methyltransferase CheR
MKTDDITERIERIIRNETGIIINPDRKVDLEIVLGSRLVINKLSADEYLDFLRKNYNEIILLASYFTIQETSFYRYKAHFDRLKLYVLPDMIERAKDTKMISILSAGCATGEEPYTLGMIISDLLGDSLPEWTVSIVATDINENALTIAREGRYSRYKLRNIDQWYIQKYFETESGLDRNDPAGNYNSVFRLKPCIKNMVTFKQVNLIREPFELSNLAGLDIIICENVIIYFCRESIQRLIDNFHSILRDGGFLFLGYSETLNIIRYKFSLSWWNESFAYVKDHDAKESLPPEAIDEPEYRTGESATASEETAVREDEIQRITPESYPELINLIIKNYRDGLVSNSLSLMRKAERSTMKLDERFFIIRAELYFDREDYINAGNESRKAISINPYFIDAHIILCSIYLNLNMLESALFEIRTALYIDPSSVLANYYCGLYNKIIENETERKRCADLARSLLKKKGDNLRSTIYPISRITENEIREKITRIDR